MILGVTRHRAVAAAAALSLLAAAIVATGCGAGDGEQSSSATSAGTFLYQKQIAGHWQLFTSRPDGSGERQITHTAGDSVDSDWSPDYSGGPVKGLNAFVGSYSPDGKHIVLRVERNDRGGLAVIDPDGRNLHMLTPIADPKPKAIDWGPHAGGGPG